MFVTQEVETKGLPSIDTVINRMHSLSLGGTEWAQVLTLETTSTRANSKNPKLSKISETHLREPGTYWTGLS